MSDYSIERISRCLRQSRFVSIPEESRTRAAVAMIISSGAAGPELLFIQRAAHELDPWSGHVAFPGGKLEQGEEVCDAARRETLEEVGIDLASAEYLGRLSDIIGANLPVRVSCCVFGMERELATPVLSDEVKAAFWISLRELTDSSRHRLSRVAFADRDLEVPAIVLPYPDAPVLWGITYRLVMQFLGVVADVGEQVAISADGCTLPETIILSEEEKHE